MASLCFRMCQSPVANIRTGSHGATSLSRTIPSSPPRKQTVSRLSHLPKQQHPRALCQTEHVDTIPSHKCLVSPMRPGLDFNPCLCALSAIVTRLPPSWEAIWTNLGSGPSPGLSCSVQGSSLYSLFGCSAALLRKSFVVLVARPSWTTLHGNSVRP